MAGEVAGNDAIDVWGAWLEAEYPRLVARAEEAVPDSPAPDADALAQRVIARACGQYELVFVPSQFHHDARARRNEILALLVLKLARVYGRPFRDAEEARTVAVRLLAQTADEEKVKAAIGTAGAFLSPLLSPDLARRTWRIFLRIPLWAKLIVAGGAIAAVLAMPMAKPLSLGLIARDEFRSGVTA